MNDKKLTKLKTVEEKKEAEDTREYVASACRDKSIKLWEVHSGICILTLTGHDNWVEDICFHPCGKYLLSVSDDYSLRIWDLSNGRQFKKMEKIHSNFVSCIDMRHKLTVTGSYDHVAKVWTSR